MWNREQQGKDKWRLLPVKEYQAEMAFGPAYPAAVPS
jgi:hypothetical protein